MKAAEEKSIATLTSKMFEDCEMLGYTHLADVGFCLARDNVFVMHGASHDRRRRIRIHGCALTEDASALLPVFSNLYEDVYDELAAMPAPFLKEAAYLGDLYTQLAFDESVSLIMTLLDVFLTLYVIVPPDTHEDAARWRTFQQIETFAVTRFATARGALLRIEKAPEKKEIALYVAAHKPCSFPKDPIYVPMWLGPAARTPAGCFDDKQEPSVAHLNPRINECTGLYAIWKHATADIVGLVHYRRFFASEWLKEKHGTMLGKEEILHLMRSFDILVYRLEYFVYPLHVQMRNDLDDDVCDRALEVFEDLIGKKQPDYLDAYHKVMNGHTFFPCNMLVTRKEIFDDFCAWLFSFLLDAAEQLDMDTYTDGNRRIAGFVAERMLTIWLTKQTLRIKELPVFLVDAT